MQGEVWLCCLDHRLRGCILSQIWFKIITVTVCSLISMVEEILANLWPWGIWNLACDINGSFSCLVRKSLQTASQVWTFSLIWPAPKWLQWILAIIEVSFKRKQWLSFLCTIPRPALLTLLCNSNVIECNVKHLVRWELEFWSSTWWNPSLASYTVNTFAFDSFGSTSSTVGIWYFGLFMALFRSRRSTQTLNFPGFCTATRLPIHSVGWSTLIWVVLVEEQAAMAWWLDLLQCDILQAGNQVLWIHLDIPSKFLQGERFVMLAS